MKLENEVCRKVYDHHEVMKGEITTTLFEILTRAKLTKEAISTVIESTNVVIDASTDKMAADYQRLFKTEK